jgi:hypothetical protein
VLWSEATRASFRPSPHLALIADQLGHVGALAARRRAQVEDSLMRLRRHQAPDQCFALVLGGAQALLERPQPGGRLVALDPHQVGREAGRSRGDLLGAQAFDELVTRPAQQVDAQPHWHGAVVGDQQRACRLGTEAIQPALDQPQRMRAPGSERLGVVAHRQLHRILLLRQPAQHAVHEPRRPGMPVLVGELDRLVHRRMRGNPVEEQDLVGAHAQDVLDPGRRLREADVHQAIQHEVEPPAPAQRALDQLVQQRLIARVLPRARVRALQQPVAEGAARVGGVQDLERRLARVGGERRDFRRLPQLGGIGDGTGTRVRPPVACVGPPVALRAVAGRSLPSVPARAPSRRDSG